MAPKIFLIIIIFLFLLGIFCLIFSILKYRKYKIKYSILSFIIGILILIYSTIVFKHLIHYNQVKQADSFWLKLMFVEYVKKYHSIPKKYSDLISATKNAHELFENSFPFISPQIKFLVKMNSDSSLIVTYYELGYDKIDDKTKIQITSPFSIWMINVRGDFLIDVHEYKKDILFQNNPDLDFFSN